MNRFFAQLASTLLLLYTAIGGFAQDANSLLWKISGKNLSKPSYLFGTIHMLPQDKYFFSDPMQKALSTSEVLALEATMDIPLAEQLKMAQEMLMPNGKTWADYLTAEEYAMVKAAFVDSLGIKEAKFEKQYNKIRPMYVSGLVLTELIGKIKMYEQELSSMAKKEKKPIIGLETLQEQMDIVSGISIEDQIAELKSGSEDILREYNKLLDAYLQQNLGELGKLATESEGFDEIEHKLLIERNRKWITIITEQLMKNSTFFAVGAMHLVGDEGLITQLRNAGYTVEAVVQ